MTSNSSPLQWSSEVRAWASLLIFAHLFAVVVGVTTYTRPSVLQRRLHDLFGPYLYNLHLATFPVSYPFARFHLTHGEPADIDFTIQVQPTATAGATPVTTTIPTGGLFPPIRNRRYQALANAAGGLIDEDGSDEQAGVLPRAIAGALLRRENASDGVVRIRAHYLAPQEDLGQNETRRKAALENYRDLYEAQVLVSGSAVELLRKSSALEAAPVKTPSGRPAAAPPSR